MENARELALFSNSRQVFVRNSSCSPDCRSNMLMNHYATPSLLVQFTLLLPQHTVLTSGKTSQPRNIVSDSQSTWQCWHSRLLLHHHLSHEQSYQNSIIFPGLKSRELVLMVIYCREVLDCYILHVCCIYEVHCMSCIPCCIHEIYSSPTYGDFIPHSIVKRSQSAASELVSVIFNQTAFTSTKVRNENS